MLGLQAHAGKGGSRAVYIAPKPELAQERFADWTQKFGAPGLGLTVCLLTGDPLADYAMLREANIVISTPEHWDMLSRRWRQQSRKEVRNVALFLVDELHLIGGANGPVLEVGSCPSIMASWQSCARVIATNGAGGCNLGRAPSASPMKGCLPIVVGIQELLVVLALRMGCLLGRLLLLLQS